MVIPQQAEEEATEEEGMLMGLIIVQPNQLTYLPLVYIIIYIIIPIWYILLFVL
jgi:hypothetical protein